MSVIVKAFDEVDGQVGEASSINRVIDDLYTLQSGNINSANLASSSIGESEIADATVTPAKLAGDFFIATQVFS